MTNGMDPIVPQDEHKYFDRTDGEAITLFNCGGLTKREYFAAMAMQSFVSAEDVGFERQKDKNANPHNTYDKPCPRSEMQIHADIWVRKADALIEALNKEVQP